MKRMATLVLLLLVPVTARAQEEEAPRGAQSPYEMQLAAAFYVTGHAGSYLAGGVGGRLRYEPFEWLGVEAYLEATIVDWPNTIRHDYPNGFNVYFPIRVGDVRVRPLLGFCDILSFIEPVEQDAPRADDVLFGAHVGVGVEWAVYQYVTVFADLVANGYLGHDRTAEGWTGGVGEEFVPFWNVALNIGAQLHVLDR
jgi:hypothetical protein